MTKVSILGDNPKCEKRIEFIGYLLEDCHGTSDEVHMKPSDCSEIILLTKRSEDNYGYDIMLIKFQNKSFIVFGHFNDGVV